MYIFTSLLIYAMFIYGCMHLDTDYMVQNIFIVILAWILAILLMGVLAATWLRMGFKTLFSSEPCLIITGESIIEYGETFINFADVQSFKLGEFEYRTGRVKYITFKYTSEAENRVKTECGFLDFYYRKAVTSILLSNTCAKIKPEELYDILNERLRNYRASQKP